MRRDLIALPPDSKVWIYQASQPVSHSDADIIKEEIYRFTMNWASHGHVLDCYGHLFHYQFLVLVADANSLPSGCSIDSSVHFVKAIGDKFKIDFFDRMQFAYLDGDHIATLSSTRFKEAVSEGQINNDTLVFNNLVDNKSDFLENWIIPLQDSWHQKFVQ